MTLPDRPSRACYANADFLHRIPLNPLGPLPVDVLQRAYYSVPPEYVGRQVWARWESRLVRVFNQRREVIAVHAQTIAITGRSYRLKDHAAIAGKEDKNKKTKSKSNEPLAAEPAS